MSSETSKHVAFRTGKKVILRPLTSDDVPLLTRWINDPTVTRYLLRVFPATLAEEEQWVKNLGRDANTNVVLGIEVKDGPLIGTMGLHHISWVNRHATSGALIGDATYRGHGYGTDAKMHLLDFAFNTLGLHKVCSSVIAYNGRSRRYNKKCGYSEEGVQREQIYRDGKFHDLIHMAVFRETWLPLWQNYQKEE